MTSGYRWVLTYKLALDQLSEIASARPSASLALSPQVDTMRQVLSGWMKNNHSFGEEPYIYHVLDHDYTEAQCSLKALKTDDLARVTALREASRDLPVDIFLALLEKEQSGSCPYEGRDRGYNQYGRYGYDDSEEEDSDLPDDASFHEFDDVHETKYRVKTLFVLEGELVAEGLKLKNDDVTNEDAWDEIEITKENYEGYMGNYGPQATHWYHIAVSHVWL